MWQPGGARFPRSGVLVRGNDRCGTAFGDGVVVLSGVEGAIGCDCGDLLLGRDLVEQLGQHGSVADLAGRELRGPDFQCSSPPHQGLS